MTTSTKYKIIPNNISNYETDCTNVASGGLKAATAFRRSE